MDFEREGLRIVNFWFSPGIATIIHVVDVNSVCFGFCQGAFQNGIIGVRLRYPLEKWFWIMSMPCVVAQIIPTFQRLCQSCVGWLFLAFSDEIFLEAIWEVFCCVCPRVYFFPET